MKYYGCTPTLLGRALIAKLLASKTLEISRVMVGSGCPDDDTTPDTLTDLIAPVAEATSNVPTYDGDTVHMIVEYRSDLNGGLESGFWLNEIGVYAIDPDVGEILLYYGCLGDYPQWVSALSDTGVDVRRFPISITIGEDAEITVDYNTEAWLTAEEAQTMIDNALNAAMSTIGTTQIVQIYIPPDIWTASSDSTYPYVADLDCAESAEDYFPAVAIHPTSLTVAQEAGVSSAVQSLDGSLRFWAQSVPEFGIFATISLTAECSTPSITTPEGGDYTLPIATATTLGGVKIGSGITIADDGTITASSSGITDDDMATDSDADAMLDEIFADEAQQTTE